MEHQVGKVLKKVSFILFIILILWVVLMVLSSREIDPNWTDLEYVSFVFHPTPVFILCYLNAVIFTCLVVIMFGLLYLYTKQDNRILSISGLLFVPIYGILNLLVYSSQIIVFPLLLRSFPVTAGSDTIYFIAQFLHKDGTVSGMLNAGAYAIIGIPSVLFGILLYRRNIFGKIAAVLLILNAAACLLGVIGGVIDNSLLSSGVVIGGFLFTIAVLFIYLMVKKEDKEAKVNV